MPSLHHIEDLPPAMEVSLEVEPSHDRTESLLALPHVVNTLVGIEAINVRFEARISTFCFADNGVSVSSIYNGQSQRVSQRFW